MVVMMNPPIVSHPEVEGETLDLSKYDGWKRVHFAKGEKRYVHVNRHAIFRNVKNGDTYPTVIVREGDKEHQFHAAIMFGAATIGFDPNPQNVDANVYMETTDKILCFVDPASLPHFSKKLVLKSSKPKINWLSVLAKPFVWLKNALWFTTKNIPILGCLVDPDHWH